MSAHLIDRAFLAAGVGTLCVGVWLLGSGLGYWGSL